MIKLVIDELGQITSQIDQVRQGDKGVVVQATFEDKDNINYVAKINLTRADGEIASGITMQPDAEHSDTFVKTLETEWYFCKHGQTSLTVYLYKNGVVDAQGQVNFNVEKTDYDGEPTITPDEYDELLELIATKLNIVNGIIKADTRSALGDLNNYTIGQAFYIKSDESKNNHHTLLEKNAQGNLQVVFDFEAQTSGIITDVEVEQEITATTITNTVKLLNSAEEVVASFEIELPSATSEKAGLMSASDKAKLSNLPTGAEIEETYETKEHAEEEHDNLQEQIDAIVSKSDVVDIVGTKAELDAYDTSKLGDNDIIKVLVDETKQNQRSYYRWLKDDEEFEYVGSEGEFYTKSESDQIFLKKVDAETKYQHKVKVMNTVPTTDDLEENEIAVVPSVEANEYIVGAGLDLTTDAQTGAKTLSVKALVITQNETTEPINKAVSVPSLTIQQVVELAGAINNKMPAFVKCGYNTYKIVSGIHYGTTRNEVSLIVDSNNITYIVNYVVFGTSIEITASDVPTRPFVLTDLSAGEVEGTYEGTLIASESARLFLHDNMIIQYNDQENSGVKHFLKRVVENTTSSEVVYKSDKWQFVLNNANYKFVLSPIVVDYDDLKNKPTIKKYYLHKIKIGGLLATDEQISFNVINTDSTKITMQNFNNKIIEQLVAGTLDDTNAIKTITVKTKLQFSVNPETVSITYYDDTGAKTLSEVALTIRLNDTVAEL